MKYTCTFDYENYPIEVTYWHNDQGIVVGEAYFKRDDLGADILDGDFAHPFSGQRYKLHTPSKWTKHKHASLDILQWKMVGQFELPKEVA
jgi:hypothetical protein